jgi:hypothetical protein
MTQLQQEQQILYGKVNSVSTVVDDLERLERTMRASLSNHVMDMLGYSARALK